MAAANLLVMKILNGVTGNKDLFPNYIISGPSREAS